MARELYQGGDAAERKNTLPSRSEDDRAAHE
jgi:hypothetical protein